MRFRNWVMFALACVPALATPVILNPSFENGPNPGGFTTILGGGGGLSDWTVTGHSIDYIGNYWVASDGGRSVDLAGNDPGGVSQLVSGFTVGGYYILYFDMSGNPDGGSNPKNLTLGITGEPNQGFAFNTSGVSHGAMGWTQNSYTFQASATSLTISFAFADSGPWGAALDNVSIEQVPEPASMVLVGLGLAALGFARRRR